MRTFGCTQFREFHFLLQELRPDYWLRSERSRLVLVPRLIKKQTNKKKQNKKIKNLPRQQKLFGTDPARSPQKIRPVSAKRLRAGVLWHNGPIPAQIRFAESGPELDRNWARYGFISCHLTAFWPRSGLIPDQIRTRSGPIQAGPDSIMSWSKSFRNLYYI